MVIGAIIIRLTIANKLFTKHATTLKANDNKGTPLIKIPLGRLLLSNWNTNMLNK